MAERKKTDGGELFIVDNSDSQWKVLQYLKERCEIARAFDIATGYFEIGSLLGLDGDWQKLEKIRILMGDEVSRRTQEALLAGVREIQGILDRSIEREKEKNDFLVGVPAIVEALRQGKIECRVYRMNKFHAKAYITHAKHAVVGASALVGSSNFTFPGLTANVELNVQLRREVAQLQEWYERHWLEAEPVTEAVLRVIERHIAEYRPFDVYAKALHEFFRGHEMTAGEWELTQSKIYRRVLNEYQRQEGCGETIFPEREPPKVVEYSVKKTYGRLLDAVDRAFAKRNPLFILGIYYPLAYYKGTEKIDPLLENRQKQVVALIRTQFLKRFESSAMAFGLSCDRLLLRLLTWVTKHSETDAEKRRLEIWKQKHGELIGYVHQQQLALWGEEDPEDADEDVVTDEMLEAVDRLSREGYRVEDILADSYEDMNQVVEFLGELQRFQPKHDDKLRALVQLLKKDAVLKRDKVLIFSEFAETARYLRRELLAQGIEGVEEIDSMSKKNRSEVIRRFAPYYNGSSSAGVAEDGETEIRVLLSTDVLSEGLNLQDATRMINYDLHWNPVRLMQRIGRVDRRMNVDIEAMIVRDHPDQKKLRGHVVYWNFLPPDDLDALLRLYTRVSHKTLRISKTFGIEGRKLLRPEDDFDALKDFNAAYEGTVSAVEKMHLEYQQLLRDHPGLVAHVEGLPGRVFSGKEHPAPGTKAVFFCYALPAVAPAASQKDGGDTEWSTELGTAAWYCVDAASGRIVEEPTEIVELIRATPQTPRVTGIAQKKLSEIRASVEKHIKNTYLKQVQAPIGVKPVLKAWMELT